jgi:hypothetical protein
LEQLFSLNRHEREELDRLLNRTSLSAIIRTSTAVTNRLDFLKALELMVFDPELNRRVRERPELHRILESETWVFGEEYALLASDQSLSAVLRKHLEVLRKPLPADTSVRREDGTQGRVDLMLSRAAFLREERHHLVVELKRPGLKLTLMEYAQLSSYAATVAQDDRFRDTATSWDFWLIGSDMDDALRSQARQKHLPPGCASDSGNVRLWVRTWAEIIEECRRRLHFYRKELEYQSENEHAVDYLVRRHSDAVERLVDLRVLPAQRAPLPSADDSVIAD